MVQDTSVGPPPLPEGEGTDWGMLQNSADLKVLC